VYGLTVYDAVDTGPGDGFGCPLTAKDMVYYTTWPNGGRPRVSAADLLAAVLLQKIRAYFSPWNNKASDLL
jgi:hypothetical protein